MEFRKLATEERHFLSDIFSRITQLGRTQRAASTSNLTLEQLLTQLHEDRGEASGLATAAVILDRLSTADDALLTTFFRSLLDGFSADPEPIRALLTKPLDARTIRQLHFLAEPPSQEILRRLNRVPGGTARLVALRVELLRLMKKDPDLTQLDLDFRHLFQSWFNRGFLALTRITWRSSAEVLQRIIAYEAVHEIKSWDDLHQRVAAPDRRLFAFFHPAMPTDPLIFVEVALTTKIPNSIQSILSAEREVVLPETAKVAVFYSISNCQEGLKGVSFGNFLIKQVVQELSKDLPNLKTFVTLSPVPGFAAWVKSEGLAKPESATAMRQLAARYLTQVKSPSGTAANSVAHFHLGNGASLHAIHADADTSEAGMQNAYGVMVNYLYESEKIDANHQAYATARSIAASSAVEQLAKH